MLWQASRRTLWRRSQRFHAGIGRSNNLEELMHGYEQAHRRPRAHGGGKDASSALDKGHGRAALDEAQHTIKQ
jgi:hypothetical protein